MNGVATIESAVSGLAMDGHLPPRIGRRVLGGIVGDLPGPTLVVIGGVHGNEPSGVRALERILITLDGHTGAIVGEFVALAGNLTALGHGVRFVERDLNRSWTDERMERLLGRSPESVTTPEDREQLALHAELQAIFERARGPVFMLDLHSTSAGGAPFVVLNDTLQNRAFAERMPVPIVLGLEEELSGTLLAWSTDLGHTTLAFESGQHDSPRSIDCAEAAVWVALESSGVLVPGTIEAPVRLTRLLEAVGAGLPRRVEVRYRHAIAPSDHFRMDPGFSNFQAVAMDQVLGQDERGPVRSPQKGLILMPLYQKLGDDGFFLVKGFRPFWMRVSAVLRAVEADRIAHWLPGVSRHPRLPETLLIDQRVARFFPREIFHLLGYKRIGVDGKRLVMSRRPHDHRPSRDHRLSHDHRSPHDHHPPHGEHRDHG